MALRDAVRETPMMSCKGACRLLRSGAEAALASEYQVLKRTFIDMRHAG